jgi:hypothetical protein
LILVLDQIALQPPEKLASIVAEQVSLGMVLHKLGDSFGRKYAAVRVLAGGEQNTGGTPCRAFLEQSQQGNVSAVQVSPVPFLD